MTTKAFETHAYKGKDETHNPNAHIIFRSSTMSVFEACRMLKEAKSDAMEQDIFGTISKVVILDVGKNKTTATDYKRSDDKEIVERIQERKWQDIIDIMKRLETIEKGMEEF
jgi:hypothetical protein